MAVDVETTQASFLRILVEQCQDLQSAFQQLRTGRWKENAIGDVLDVLGRIIGQPRNGLADEDYRRYLSAREIANNSNGCIEDLLQIAALIIDDDTATIVLDNQGAACCVVRVEDITVSNDLANTLIEFLRYPSVKGGVRVILETSTILDTMTWDVDTWDAKPMRIARDRARVAT